VDAFVHCVGTAASSRGVATVLKRHKPGVRIVAVEPAESSVLLGGPPGPHGIEGVGIGYRPPLWEPPLVDDVVAVATLDAKEMTRRLAQEEGLFAGTSSGANVIAAIEVGKRLGPRAKVVTLLADSGLKYLNTDVDRRAEPVTRSIRRRPEGNASLPVPRRRRRRLRSARPLPRE
jgi:cysteine synthase A